MLSDQLDEQKSRSDTKPHLGQVKQFPRVKEPNLTCFRCGGRRHKAPDCSSQVEGISNKKGSAGSEDPRSSFKLEASVAESLPADNTPCKDSFDQNIVDKAIGQCLTITVQIECKPITVV